jgi:hypothetical protein
VIRPAVLALAAASIALPAAAQERFRPHITGEAELQFRPFRTHGSTLPERRNWDTTLKGAVSFGIHLTPTLSIQGEAKYEPLLEPPSDRNRRFSETGAFLEQFFVNWQADPDYAFFAGKFTAPFGIGYHDFPGIRARDFAEAYEFSERIGAGLDWTFLADARFGTHDIRAAFFQQDTSFLTQTAFYQPRFGADRVERARSIRRWHGGPSNSGRPGSFAVGLFGELPAPVDGLAYHLGVSGQQPGDDGTSWQWAYVGAITWFQAWGAGFSSKAWIEAVRFINTGGRPLAEDGSISGDRDTLLTLALRVNWHDWRATAVYQRQETTNDAGAPPGYNYVELSVGRKFLDIALGAVRAELSGDIGWSRTRSASDDGHPIYDRAVLGLVTLAARF